MANWLCPIDEANWGIILEKRVYGVSNKYRLLFDQVQPSDTFVFFIKDTFELRGIYRVNSYPFENAEIRMLDNSAFPAKITYWVKMTERVMPVRTNNLQNLLATHDLLRSRRRWLLSQLGKPLIPLTDGEYQILYEVLKEACSVLNNPEGNKQKSWQYYRLANKGRQGY